MHRTMCVVLLAPTLLALAACTTPAYRPTEQKIASLSDTREALGHALAQCDASLEVLDGVIMSAGKDSRAPYDKYVVEVRKLEDAVADVQRRVSDLHTMGASYFDLWRKEAEKIHSEELRSRTTDRARAVQDWFNGVADALQSVDGPFSAFARDMQDISLYLAFNLNKSGIRSIGDLVERARKDRERVGVHAGYVNVAIDRLARTFDPAGGSP